MSDTEDDPNDALRRELDAAMEAIDSPDAPWLDGLMKWHQHATELLLKSPRSDETE